MAYEYENDAIIVSERLDLTRYHNQAKIENKNTNADAEIEEINDTSEKGVISIDDKK